MLFVYYKVLLLLFISLSLAFNLYLAENWTRADAHVAAFEAEDTSAEG